MYGNYAFPICETGSVYGFGNKLFVFQISRSYDLAQKYKYTLISETVRVKRNGRTFSSAFFVNFIKIKNLNKIPPKIKKIKSF